MKRSMLTVAALATLVAGTPAIAATVVVQGTATVYPGNPGGSTPATTVTLGGATDLTFAVTGSITFNGGGNFNSADGIGAASSYGVNASGGVSGIAGPYAGVLVGVFENASGPDALNTPVSLSYNAAGSTMQASYAPLLNQAFFIGDGLDLDNAIGLASGMTQLFNVPTGATVLLLGFADAGGYFGEPGSYNDNSGFFSVTINGAAGAVPEPAGWAMMLAGVGLAGATMRRRRAVVRCA